MEPDQSAIFADQIGRELWLVVVRGEHDAATAPRIEAELQRIGATGTDIVVDLSEASFIDSSIARVLVEYVLYPPTGEAIAVVAPPETFPRRALSVLGLDTMLPTHDTRDDALKALGR